MTASIIFPSFVNFPEVELSPLHQIEDSKHQNYYHENADNDA